MWNYLYLIWRPRAEFHWNFYKTFLPALTSKFQIYYILCIWHGLCIVIENSLYRDFRRQVFLVRCDILQLLNYMSYISLCFHFIWKRIVLFTLSRSPQHPISYCVCLILQTRVFDILILVHLVSVIFVYYAVVMILMSRKQTINMYSRI